MFIIEVLSRLPIVVQLKLVVRSGFLQLRDPQTLRSHKYWLWPDGSSPPTAQAYPRYVMATTPTRHKYQVITRAVYVS